ncbi:protocatechuate 3,4-dioxygenase beta subunit [Aspergillus leporis]|jgi:protocatechuate 3,4-dioxygenase beta subunit|uniref:Protocatechuate 3,4-dioxygenase beta subunit n=1 Tax=Aspergillus leporis TaxID=41062 RepID=A0A5N5XHP8_9EURO|nr:protocatechuate 3,4-dioxygenase beta subunit [Aspergillus leporis]
MSASEEVQKITQQVVDSFGPLTTPRMREVMSSLVRHLHDFAREVSLQYDEWEAGVRYMNSVGQASTPTRNEGHRLSNILGLESLVTQISYVVAADSTQQATSPSILGPFWSPYAPYCENGDNIARSPHQGQTCVMHGHVTDLRTNRAIPNAIVDIWQASSNGKYDFQDTENQEPMNLRGKFHTNQHGYYYFYCLKPTAYSLPHDGPAWELLQALDRHSMRPAHIHLMVSHPEYVPVITQLYPDDDPYIYSDTVFAVKDDLVVNFTPRENDPKAELDLHFDIVLEPASNTISSFL